MPAKREKQAPAYKGACFLSYILHPIPFASSQAATSEESDEPPE